MSLKRLLDINNSLKAYQIFTLFDFLLVCKCQTFPVCTYLILLVDIWITSGIFCTF